MADEEFVIPIEEGHIPETSGSFMEEGAQTLDDIIEGALIFTLPVSYGKLKVWLVHHASTHSFLCKYYMVKCYTLLLIPEISIVPNTTA